MNLPLKNVQNTGGKYALFFMDGAGNWQRVEKIGMSVRPFQVVATFDGRPYIAVQKNGNVRTPDDTRLFLINLRNGTVVPGGEFGVSRIIFDTNNKSIFFTPFASNGVPVQKYSWCLPYGGVSYMAINIPSISQPGVRTWGATSTLVPVFEIAVVEFVPRANCASKKTDTPKRRRGRPRGSKNAPKATANINAQHPLTQKRKRGRPRGSKNKVNVLSRGPIAQNIPAKLKMRTNMVSLRNTKRNAFGGLYDVYINGRRVATKRMNANAKTFMNNRILALSYQVPAGPTDIYDIFWPNGTQFYIGDTHRITGQPITVNSVSEQNNELRLGLSNNDVRVIRENDLARFAPQQFVLNEKQK